MKNLIDLMLEKTPSAIAKFTSSTTSIALPTRWNSGSDFITKIIGCHCGNQLLSLEADQKKELRGICSKAEVMTYYPPVYAVCSSCKCSTLVFDPIVHGWNGEMEITHDSESALRLVKYNVNPGLIYVNYSYRNIENYESLLADGVQDIENYFDSFTVLYSDMDGKNFTEITSNICV